MSQNIIFEIFRKNSEYLYTKCRYPTLTYFWSACNIISVHNIHLMSRTGSPFSILKYTRDSVKICATKMTH